MVARIASLVLLAAALSTPALAQAASTAIPDPSGVALFGLGLAGVILGRHLSRRRPGGE
ncbi:MAG TPA: PEP-CTERM sorting domain-containing protein [Novosphingobium sp.]|nr:PEP-CTERM sorting domain-containing protein [Novosphingobium sp.]